MFMWTIINNLYVQGAFLLYKIKQNQYKYYKVCNKKLYSDIKRIIQHF